MAPAACSARTPSTQRTAPPCLPWCMHVAACSHPSHFPQEDDRLHGNTTILGAAVVGHELESKLAKQRGLLPHHACVVQSPHMPAAASRALRSCDGCFGGGAIRYAVVDLTTVHLAGDRFRMVQVRAKLPCPARGPWPAQHALNRYLMCAHAHTLDVPQLADPYGSVRVDMQQHTWSPSSQIWDTPRGVAMKHLLGGSVSHTCKLASHAVLTTLGGRVCDLGTGQVSPEASWRPVLDGVR